MKLRDYRVKREEWYALILSFIYFFSVLASYYVVRPIRDQLAAQVGSAELPVFFAATFIVILLLTPLFSWLVTHWPRRIVMPTVYGFFILCQLAFIPLFAESSFIPSKFHIPEISFFVWISVFNLFVVSVFWSYMADIWSDTQARRLFPIIALGGTTGAIIGPIITRNLVGEIGLASLLAVSAAMLLVALVCIILLERWVQKYGLAHNKIESSEGIGGGILDGLKQIFCDPFIRNMSLMMLLSDAIGTIAYVLITDYSSITFPYDAIGRTRFAANIDLATNIIQVIVQLTITRLLLVRYGASSVFLAFSLIIVSFCLYMTWTGDPYRIVVGSMPLIAIALILTRSLSYGMIQSARETLYTLVPRALRFKGKNAVDTVVWRAGDVISLFAITGFRSLGLTVSGFGIVWAIFAAASGGIGWHLSKQVEK